MLMLINPNGESSRSESKTRRHPRKVSAKQRAARLRFAKLAKAGKLKKGVSLGSLPAQTNAGGKSTRATENGHMAGKKKKRRRHRARSASGRFTANGRGATKRSAKKRHHKYGAFQYNRKRRGRGFRRNPSLSTRGIAGSVMAAARDAAIITGAQIATNKVASMIPGGTTPAVAIAKQVGVGIGLSLVARKFAPRWAHQVLVGALLAPVQTAVRAALPNIGLNGYPIHGAGRGMAKYVLPAGQGNGGMGAYVPWPQNGQAGGMGSYMANRKAAYYQ